MQPAPTSTRIVELASGVDCEMATIIVSYCLQIQVNISLNLCNNNDQTLCSLALTGDLANLNVCKPRMVAILIHKTQCNTLLTYMH